MSVDLSFALHKARAAILKLSGEIDAFEIGPPATVAEVDSMERVIGRTIPPTLRRIFTEQSAALKLSWTLEAKLPGGLGRGLSGNIDLSLADLPNDFLNWTGWRAAFESPAEHGWPAEWNVDAYSELFPLVAALNGDQIVVADRDEETWSST